MPPLDLLAAVLRFSLLLSMATAFLQGWFGTLGLLVWLVS
jgi:hypothetical protein